MTSSDILQPLRAYVVENFLYAQPDLVLADDDGLLERGIIDSMGVMELVQFVQDRFGIEVADEDITEENLGSLAAIARFVASKRAAVAA